MSGYSVSGCSMRIARAKLRATLASLPLIEADWRRTWWAFVLVNSARGNVILPRHAPFGWRWERNLDRRAWRLMPLWIYWLRRLWFARWAWIRPLIRRGIMVGPEGGYYREFRPWCWASIADGMNAQRWTA